MQNPMNDLEGILGKQMKQEGFSHSQYQVASNKIRVEQKPAYTGNRNRS